ncbi:MAG: hypothetical protein ACRDNO_00505 [Trebonia sp.]
MTTVTPLTCAVFSAPLAVPPLAVPPLAGAALDVEAAALEGAPPALPLDDELEHAAALSATAAVPAAATIVIRIRMVISFAVSSLFGFGRPDPC